MFFSAGGVSQEIDVPCPSEYSGNSGIVVRSVETKFGVDSYADDLSADADVDDDSILDFGADELSRIDRADLSSVGCAVLAERQADIGVALDRLLPAKPYTAAQHAKILRFETEMRAIVRLIGHPGRSGSATGASQEEEA